MSVTVPLALVKALVTGQLALSAASNKAAATKPASGAAAAAYDLLVGRQVLRDGHVPQPGDRPA